MMSADFSDDSDRDRLTRDSAFALAIVFLLLLIPTGYGLYRYFQPPPVTATALFSVSSESDDLLGDGRLLDEHEFDILQRTQLAFLKSYFVHQAALRAPGIETLSILAPHEDKVQWLIDNVDAKFPNDSQILSLSLTGPPEYEDDLRQLVDALSDAYLSEVVFEAHQRRLVINDAKQRALESLRKKFENQSQQYDKLDTNSSAGRALATLAKSDINALEFVYRQLAVQLEQDEIQDIAPDRIRRVQKATIDPE